jgi:hypothetical protein
LVQWYVENAGSPSAAVNWLKTAHQAVQPYSVGGYVNYIESGQPRHALRPELLAHMLRESGSRLLTP